MNELKTLDKQSDLTIDRKLSIMRAAGKDISPSTLEQSKTPLSKRIKKSKFNKLISEMTDNDLKLTAYAICFNDDVAKAVKCYHTSVTNYVQVAALVKELESRDITIN